MTGSPLPELVQPSPGSNRCGGRRRCPVPNAEPVPTPDAPGPPVPPVPPVLVAVIVVVVVVVVEDVASPAAGCDLDKGDDDLSEETEERAARPDLSSARLLNAVPK